MPKVKFTARWVSALKPSTVGQLDYWDSHLPGFSLRITGTGRKTWTVYYRFHGRKRRVSLGTYPAVSLAEASSRARLTLAQMHAGVDPAAERDHACRERCFRDLATEYVQRHAKKKRSGANDRWMIDRHLLPRWGRVKAGDIARPDVIALVESIADGGAPVLANRVLALISKMFNFAVNRGWRDTNPAQGVERPGVERPRDRCATVTTSRCRCRRSRATRRARRR